MTHYQLEIGESFIQSTVIGRKTTNNSRKVSKPERERKRVKTTVK
jgi:hypothetical protein